MRLVVARVGRAHGIRGEVSVGVHTDVPDQRFVPGQQMFVADGARQRALTESGWPTQLTLTRVRDHNGVLLLSFAEIADRTQAEAFRGALLEVEVPDHSDEPDAWYDHQLVGLTVTDPSGESLGRVVGVDHLPAQDLLVVRRPAGDERLVPFVHALVPEVDLAAGVLVVDAPAGLLDDRVPGDDVPDEGVPDDGVPDDQARGFDAS